MAHAIILHYYKHISSQLTIPGIYLSTVWRETLAVGKFGEFTAKCYWRNKIWRICYVAS